MMGTPREPHPGRDAYNVESRITVRVDQEMVDIDNNCLPIEINLNWNQNEEYNLSQYFPECNYEPISNPLLSLQKASL